VRRDDRGKCEIRVTSGGARGSCGGRFRGAGGCEAGDDEKNPEHGPEPRVPPGCRPSSALLEEEAGYHRAERVRCFVLWRVAGAE
jgi:hypothetical protein